MIGVDISLTCISFNSQVATALTSTRFSTRTGNGSSWLMVRWWIVQFPFQKNGSLHTLEGMKEVTQNKAPQPLRSVLRSGRKNPAQITSHIISTLHALTTHLLNVPKPSQGPRGFARGPAGTGVGGIDFPVKIQALWRGFIYRHRHCVDI